MAKVSGINGHGLSGKLGGVVFKYYAADDITVVQKVPDMSNIAWTQKQVMTRQRMKRAHAMAQYILHDDLLKADFAAQYGCPLNKVYHTAIKVLMAYLKEQETAL